MPRECHRLNRSKFNQPWLTDIRFEQILTKKESIYYYISLTIGFFGIIPLVFAFTSTFISPHREVAILFWVITLLTLGLGITSMFVTLRKIKRRSDILIENEILKRATAVRGKLMQDEIYVLPFPKRQCEKVIDNLIHLGICEIKQFTAIGDIYYFPHVISLDEKMRAKGVTEC